LPEAGRGRGGGGGARAALAAGLLLLAAAAGPAAAPSGRSAAPVPAPLRSGAPADTVVLISVDGLRWDLPERAGAARLQRMAAEGAAASLVPPFPANTFPAHATLATGVHPDRHGIMNNEFLDRGRGLFRRDDDPSWLLAEPLWVTAERQGVRAAVYHWVASAGAWRGTAATLRHRFDGSVTDSEKAAAIARWIGRRDARRPRLILSYWHGPDGVGHREGPEGGGVLRRVRQTDRLIGRVLDAAAGSGRRVAVIVVSDHGMAATATAHPLDRLLAGAGRGTRALASGATANIYCRDRNACARAAAALRALDGAVVHRRDELPPAWRYRHAARTGDLVAVAPPGSYFTERESDRPPAAGMHGYGPERPEMHGVFRAWGAGIRRSAALDGLSATDVAPLVCRLLGIAAPPGIDGRVPDALLAGPDL
jgi:predicted AlkP superfamily pyrophosphatase or phosphodiesterase